MEYRHVLVAGDNRGTPPGICSLGQRSTRVFVSHFGPFVDWLHGDALLGTRASHETVTAGSGGGEGRTAGLTGSVG